MTILTIELLEGQVSEDYKVDMRNRIADPYVTFQLLDSGTLLPRDSQPIQKSSVCRNTLSPVWNERFNIDVDLNNDILKITLMDYDRITKDDIVGLYFLRFNEYEPFKTYLKPGKEICLDLILGKDQLNFWEQVQLTEVSPPGMVTLTFCREEI